MIWELVAAVLLGAAGVWFMLAPVGGRRRVRLPALDPFDMDETRRERAVEALREIEFDRATGKLSDEDYAALKARYTAQAVKAMRAERPAATPDADLEAMISARRLGVNTGSCPSCGPRPEAEAAFCSSCGLRLPTGHDCAACGASIPAGAGYCEVCGVRQAA